MTYMHINWGYWLRNIPSEIYDNACTTCTHGDVKNEIMKGGLGRK
jgi:hypothetical protein